MRSCTSRERKPPASVCHTYCSLSKCSPPPTLGTQCCADGAGSQQPEVNEHSNRWRPRSTWHGRCDVTRFTSHTASPRSPPRVATAVYLVTPLVARHLTSSHCDAASNSLSLCSLGPCLLIAQFPNHAAFSQSSCSCMDLVHTGHIKGFSYRHCLRQRSWH